MRNATGHQIGRSRGPRVDQHAINQHVRAFSAAGHEYTHDEGRVVSYAEQPSVTIERADGTRFSWMAHLCELIDPPEPPLTEPGTWGVVEAACVHAADRKQWVRHPDGNWHPCETRALPRDTDYTYSPDDWDSLVEPVLIRPGIDTEETDDHLRD